MDNFSVIPATIRMNLAKYKGDRITNNNWMRVSAETMWCMLVVFVWLGVQPTFHAQQIQVVGLSLRMEEMGA